MSKTMKAVLFNQFGGAEVLRLAEIPIPSVGRNEVLVKISYTSVNPVDWKIREGHLQSLLPHELPIIPGWDAAGTIAEVGLDAKGFNLGDRVYAYCRKPTVQWGTYAEYVVLDAANVAPMPKSLSFAEAAALPLVGLTAWQALHEVAHVLKGQTILITGGAGGVGNLAIQFAREAGLRVITTASEPKHEYVKSLGANEVVDYRKGFVKAVRELAPEGVDVVFDCVGGETLRAAYELVKKGGRLVTIVESPDLELSKAHEVFSSFHFVSPSGAQLREIGSLVEAGKIKVPQIEEMPLVDAAKAQEQNQERRQVGKLVLKVS